MTGEIDDRRRTEGERLIEALDVSGVKVHAALWVFRPTLDEWRLVIATPEVARRGPRAVIQVINNEVVRANGHLSFDLFDVEIYDPQNSHLIELFNSLDGLGLPLRGLTLSGIELAGSGIADFHIYRIEEDRIIENEQRTSLESDE